MMDVVVDWLVPGGVACVNMVWLAQRTIAEGRVSELFESSDATRTLDAFLRSLSIQSMVLVLLSVSV